MNRYRTVLTVLAYMSALAVSAARADGPVAIVEAVGPSTKGVELMQVLSVGDVLRLKGGDTVRIGYFQTCAVESIAGGEVTIGAGQSTVVGGTVEREQATCDVGQFRTTTAQSQLAGAATFRKAAKPKKGMGSPKPQLVIYGTSPVVSVPGEGAELTISAAGSNATGHAVRLGPGTHDLGEHGVRLVPGRTYIAAAGDRTVTFKVSAAAEDGAVPAISRYLPL